jgi:hypothetical protein
VHVHGGAAHQDALHGGGPTKGSLHCMGCVCVLEDLRGIFGSAALSAGIKYSTYIRSFQYALHRMYMHD